MLSPGLSRCPFEPGIRVRDPVARGRLRRGLISRPAASFPRAARRRGPTGRWRWRWRCRSRAGESVQGAFVTGHSFSRVPPSRYPASLAPDSGGARGRPAVRPREEPGRPGPGSAEPRQRPGALPPSAQVPASGSPFISPCPPTHTQLPPPSPRVSESPQRARAGRRPQADRLSAPSCSSSFETLELTRGRAGPSGPRVTLGPIGRGRGEAVKGGRRPVRGRAARGGALRQFSRGRQCSWPGPVAARWPQFSTAGHARLPAQRRVGNEATQGAEERAERGCPWGLAGGLLPSTRLVSPPRRLAQGPGSSLAHFPSVRLPPASCRQAEGRGRR